MTYVLAALAISALACVAYLSYRLVASLRSERDSFAVETLATRAQLAAEINQVEAERQRDASEAKAAAAQAAADKALSQLATAQAALNAATSRLAAQIKRDVLGATDEDAIRIINEELAR